MLIIDSRIFKRGLHGYKSFLWKLQNVTKSHSIDYKKKKEEKQQKRFGSAPIYIYRLRQWIVATSFVNAASLPSSKTIVALRRRINNLFYIVLSKPRDEFYEIIRLYNTI